MARWIFKRYYININFWKFDILRSDRYLYLQHIFCVQWKMWFIYDTHCIYRHGSFLQLIIPVQLFNNGISFKGSNSFPELGCNLYLKCYLLFRWFIIVPCMLWYEIEIKDLKIVVIDFFFSCMRRAHPCTNWLVFTVSWGVKREKIWFKWCKPFHTGTLGPSPLNSLKIFLPWEKINVHNLIYIYIYIYIFWSHITYIPHTL